MNSEILTIIKEKGILFEKEIFDVLNSIEDIDIAKSLIENLERATGEKMITRASLNKNFETVQAVVNDLDKGAKNSFEKVCVKLGINIEITKKKITFDKEEEVKDRGYKVFYAETKPDKKLDVSDFVGHFRSRYKQIQSILMKRTGFDDLTSINKISGGRRNFTIIGMITEKRATKNKHLMIKVEDLTGQLNTLVKLGSDCFKDAADLQLDEIVILKCSGDNELAFVREVIYPESAVLKKNKFNEESCLAFISDIHVGSKNFLEDEFENFINWLGSDDELAKKIKYLFVVGDAVDGVGVFPGQERLLNLKSLKSQYDRFGELVRKIPERITLFMCPGQHDASRVLEPQPIVDRTYAGDLYEIPNLVLVSNPTVVKFFENEKEFQVLMYHGASIHNFINNIEELRLIKAHRHPAKAVKEMLKRRHLAPSHGVSASVVYVPNPDKDPLVITETPDILCTGEVHRLDIEKHNGTLILTGSCWQARTEFEEKIGNIPDPCKVPVFNLKTHELRILDFTISEDRNLGKLE